MTNKSTNSFYFLSFLSTLSFEHWALIVYDSW